ncbi:MAG: hypothetical protein K9I85_03745 [Saprospiraceae bacterium]|nr:hypothetical protein [Saprospiraceae bacterium]
MRHIPLPLFLICLILLSSCGSRKTDLSDPDDFEAYIAAFSGPLIARTSPLLVTFTAPYGKGQEDKEIKPNPFTIDPSISGSALWEDDYTLRFTPSEPLQSGADYIVHLDLDHLVQGLPDSLSTFHFQVRVKDQFLRLQLEDLTIPDASNPQLFSLKGILHTNDLADPQKVEACLSIPDLGGNAKITWDHDPGGLVHRFIIRDIAQDKEDQEIAIHIDGRPLELDQTSEEALIIPGSAQFRVANMRVEQGSQSIVHLVFSHLVNRDQDLTGLILIREKPALTPRFLIDKNRITCYFPERLEGIFNLDVLVGVRNIQGQRLTQPYSARTSFTQVAPQVRLAGNGMILPQSSELYFPFEAVNLEAVEVEIFKIYTNNILQFLQVNSLDGSYELQRVGKIIHRSTVNLSALNPERNNFEWVRYALDLAPLIQKDPKAIYQVRIGFLPNQTAYSCDEPITSDVSSEGDDQDYWQPTDHGENSIMDAYWGPMGYHNGYSWENRDNPCTPEYYNADRFIARNVLASDLGITVKMGDNGDILTVVTDLRTANPISRAEVQFYDQQIQRIQTVRTDERGIYLGKVKTPPDFVVVHSGVSSGYLVLRRNESLSTSDFETSGVAVQKGLRGFTYTERGVWRPGDSIYMNLILHDPENTLPDHYPVSMELFDPRGRLSQKVVNATPVGPIYAFPIATGPDAPTGSWHAKFMAGGAVFHHYLRVETIKPNRLKLKLDFGKDRLSMDEEPIRATLKANWLHGAPAKNQAVQIEAKANHIRPNFKGFEGYSFVQPERQNETFSGFVWAEGMTDESGTYQIKGKQLFGSQRPPGKVRMDFKFRVNEPGGGFSQDFRSIEYDPYQSYCGVSVPKNKNGTPTFGPNEKVTITFACVDPSGKPIAGRKLALKKVKLKWRWWWERYRDNRMDYNQQDGEDLQQETTVTTDRNGLATWTLTFQEYARYLLEACDQVSGHCAGANIYIYDRSSPSNRDARYFAFSTDKETYAPDEEVRINLPGAPAAKALISVESGAGILEAHLIPLKPDQTTYTIKVSREMVPNVYLNVALIQPHDETGNDLPLRLYSVRSINVQDPQSQIQPVLEAPDEMRPDQKYDITVRESNGKPMSYTLALVDEGLLDLTRFPTPDPYRHIFSKQALGVSTWDVFDQVLGGYAGELRRIVAIGGDAAAAKPDGSPKANRFKPAIIHLGPFELKAGRTAKHRISIDNYVGSVRMMAVAAGNLAYGHAEKTIPIRKPLMTVATLPRQLGIREELALPVTVFAMDKKIKSATVTVKESSGLVKFTGSQTASLTFASPEEKTLYFPIKVLERSGIARFKIEVKGQGETASQEVEINVRNPNPAQTVTHTQLIKAGQSATITAPLIGTAGTNRVQLEAFTLPPAQVTKHLNYLMNYSFGCLEQTTSKVFPLLYMDKLSDIPEAAARDIRDRVTAGILRILSMKDGSGQLNYWPTGNYHHMWSEIYATLFLQLAKKQGYSVSESSLRSIMSNQKRLANEWSSDKKVLEKYGQYTLTEQAFRLFMLAVSGEPQLGAMNRLMEVANLPELERWLLASAYARAGKMDISKRLTSGMSRSVSIYRDSRYTFGSDVRDMGLMVISMLDANDRTNAFITLKAMAERMNSDQWYSTHSLAIGLWAYASYAQTVPDPASMSLTYVLSDGTKKQVGTSQNMLRIELAPPKVDNKPLVITNNSKTEVFVQLTMTGQPDLAREKAEAKGITLVVSYSQPNGSACSIDRMARGTDFIGTAKVWNASATGEALTEVALQQIIPTGWEIRNLKMDQVAITTLKSSPFKYQDVRDDQVNHFFDLFANKNKDGNREPQTYHMALTASYPGKFYLPAQKVEAMYNPDFSAIVPGKWVEVYDPALEGN